MKSLKIKIFCWGVLFLALSGLASAQQVEELSAAYLDTFGTQKQLPFTKWGFMPTDRLAQMDALALSDSPIVRDYLTKVLLEKTYISTDTHTDGTVLKARMHTLMRLGQYEQVQQLLNQIPTPRKDSDFQRIQMDVLWSLKKWEDACVLAGQKRDLFFKEYGACLALWGRVDEAQLLIDVYLEENPIPDNYTALLRQLIGGPKAQIQVEILTPIESFIGEQLGLYKPNVAQNIPSYTPFLNAVNIEKLVSLWKQKGIEPQEQAYRLYLLNLYVQLFRPDLRQVRTQSLWQIGQFQGQVSLLDTFLTDKPASQMSGADLILALTLLNEKKVNINNALLLLQKSGLDVEPWILEQINN